MLKSTVRDLLWVKENVVENTIPVSYEVLGHDVEPGWHYALELVDDERRADHWRGSYEDSLLSVMNAGLVVVPIDKELGGGRR